MVCSYRKDNGVLSTTEILNGRGGANVQAEKEDMTTKYASLGSDDKRVVSEQ